MIHLGRQQTDGTGQVAQHGLGQFGMGLKDSVQPFSIYGDDVTFGHRRRRGDPGALVKEGGFPHQVAVLMDGQQALFTGGGADIASGLAADQIIKAVRFRPL